MPWKADLRVKNDPARSAGMGTYLRIPLLSCVHWPLVVRASRPHPDQCRRDARTTISTATRILFGLNQACSRQLHWRVGGMTVAFSSGVTHATIAGPFRGGLHVRHVAGLHAACRRRPPRSAARRGRHNVDGVWQVVYVECAGRPAPPTAARTVTITNNIVNLAAYGFDAQQRPAIPPGPAPQAATPRNRRPRAESSECGTCATGNADPCRHAREAGYHTRHAREAGGSRALQPSTTAGTPTTAATPGSTTPAPPATAAVPAKASTTPATPATAAAPARPSTTPGTPATAATPAKPSTTPATAATAAATPAKPSTAPVTPAKPSTTPATPGIASAQPGGVIPPQTWRLEFGANQTFRATPVAGGQNPAAVNVSQHSNAKTGVYLTHDYLCLSFADNSKQPAHSVAIPQVAGVPNGQQARPPQQAGTPVQQQPPIATPAPQQQPAVSVPGASQAPVAAVTAAHPKTGKSSGQFVAILRRSQPGQPPVR